MKEQHVESLLGGLSGSRFVDEVKEKAGHRVKLGYDVATKIALAHPMENSGTWLALKHCPKWE